jgi:hypothetical protein
MNKKLHNIILESINQILFEEHGRIHKDLENLAAVILNYILSVVTEMKEKKLSEIPHDKNEYDLPIDLISDILINQYHIDMLDIRRFRLFLVGMKYIEQSSHYFFAFDTAIPSHIATIRVSPIVIQGLLDGSLSNNDLFPKLMHELTHFIYYYSNNDKRLYNNMRFPKIKSAGELDKKIFTTEYFNAKTEINAFINEAYQHVLNKVKNGQIKTDMNAIYEALCENIPISYYISIPKWINRLIDKTDGNSITAINALYEYFFKSSSRYETTSAKGYRIISLINKNYQYIVERLKKATFDIIQTNRK